MFLSSHLCNEREMLCLEGSMCQDRQKRGWSIAVSLWHPLLPNVWLYLMYNIWTGSRWGDCYLCQFTFSPTQLCSDSLENWVITGSFSISESLRCMWQDKETVWVPLSQQPDEIQVVTNWGYHGDLGEDAPFACLWSQDFGGALGENVHFLLIWDLTQYDWNFP